MTAFQDIIGSGVKSYSTEDKIEILVHAFMNGISRLVEAMELTEEDIQDLKTWYEEDVTAKVLSRIDDSFSPEQQSAIFQWISNPLNDELQLIQLDIQEEITPRVMQMIAVFEDRRMKRRREEREKNKEWET